MSPEKWRWIPGYEGLYLVSDQGRVFSMPSKTHYGHMMKLGESSYGYLRVCLCKENNKRGYQVHRLVASAFIDNPDGKPEVNHKDGNRQNNAAANLEWVTRSENEKHAYAVLGKKPNAPWRGKPREFARVFSDKTVRKIRASNEPSRALAARYGVSKTTILNIKNNQIYKETN